MGGYSWLTPALVPIQLEHGLSKFAHCDVCFGRDYSVAVSIQQVDDANEAVNQEQAKQFNKSTFALAIARSIIEITMEPNAPTYSETIFKGGFILGFFIGLIVLMIMWP